MLDPDGKMMTEVRDFKPYFLLVGRRRGKEGVGNSIFDVMNMTDIPLF